MLRQRRPPYSAGSMRPFCACTNGNARATAMSARDRRFITASKENLGSQLHVEWLAGSNPWRVVAVAGVGEQAEAGRARQRRPRVRPIGQVEHVEDLAAQLQRRPVVQLRCLEDREIDGLE